MTIRKGRSTVMTFAPVDTTNRPARKTGITFAAGDSKISKDGGAFANTSNSPSEITVGSGRYSLTLTATEMACDTVHVYIEKSGIDPVDYIQQTSGAPTGTVVTDGANSATTFKTDLTQSADAYWRDVFLTFVTGSLIGQTHRVTVYDGTTKFVSFDTPGFTAAPSNGDRFVLVNE